MVWGSDEVSFLCRTLAALSSVFAPQMVKKRKWRADLVVEMRKESDPGDVDYAAKEAQWLLDAFYSTSWFLVA